MVCWVCFLFGLWVMLAGSSVEKLLGRIERWERRERNIYIYIYIFFILFDCVIFIIFIELYVKIESGMLGKS